MLAAIQKASDEQIGRDSAAEFVQLIQTYWMPEVRAISDQVALRTSTGTRVRVSIA
jgi:hypothetical protein